MRRLILLRHGKAEHRASSGGDLDRTLTPRGVAESAAIARALTAKDFAPTLALVSIVIGGLLFMFGEAGAKRQISGIVFGGGLALFAAQFLVWLF